MIVFWLQLEEVLLQPVEILMRLIRGEDERKDLHLLDVEEDCLRSGKVARGRL